MLAIHSSFHNKKTREGALNAWIQALPYFHFLSAGPTVSCSFILFRVFPPVLALISHSAS